MLTNAQSKLLADNYLTIKEAARHASNIYHMNYDDALSQAHATSVQTMINHPNLTQVEVPRLLWKNIVGRTRVDAVNLTKYLDIDYLPSRMEPSETHDLDTLIDWQDALNELPPNRAEIAKLFIDGLNSVQIAKHLGKSCGWIARMQHKIQKFVVSQGTI
jgi:hypothetical protein